VAGVVKGMRALKVDLLRVTCRDTEGGRGTRSVRAEVELLLQD
jgi:hypothetical protein